LSRVSEVGRFSASILFHFHCGVPSADMDPEHDTTPDLTIYQCQICTVECVERCLYLRALPRSTRNAHVHLTLRTIGQVLADLHNDFILAVLEPLGTTSCNALQSFSTSHLRLEEVPHGTPKALRYHAPRGYCSTRSENILRHELYVWWGG
jgi:hypothetical protein